MKTIRFLIALTLILPGFFRANALDSIRLVSTSAGLDDDRLARALVGVWENVGYREEFLSASLNLIEGESGTAQIRLQLNADRTYERLQKSSGALQTEEGIWRLSADGNYLFFQNTRDEAIHYVRIKHLDLDELVLEMSAGEEAGVSRDVFFNKG